MNHHRIPFIFILSWNRPIYLWVCLDSIYRHTTHPCKIIIADNNSDDPLVKEIIKNFDKRGLFHAVHFYDENDPFRLKKLVDQYWDEIDEYFVFIESDIEILPLEDKSCWLTEFVTYLEEDPELGIVGSRVYQNDFINMENAKILEPHLSDDELTFLIKANAPMRKYQHTDDTLISPHNPPLRLLMIRKDNYALTGFGRDTEIHKRTIENGYKSRISTKIVHRHLSLLNIFDYNRYSGHARDAFFNEQIPKKQKIVAILGMHRSGTSALTGSLQEKGLFLGDVKTSSPFNKKGNRENPHIFTFHDELFSTNSGTWSNPPQQIIWNDSHIKTLKNIVLSYHNQPIWGFKDPRSILTIEKWVEIFSENADFVFIATFRHPMAVALSLLARDNIPIDHGLNLWLSYNSKLLQLCEKFPISLINFDSSHEEYKNRIHELSKSIGLDVPNSDIQFYDPKLMSSGSGDFETLPIEIHKIYSLLLEKYQASTTALVPNHSARRINFIASKLASEKYLEIGVRRGKTFLGVDIKNKVAVDPNFIFAFAQYQSTSIKFFEMTSDEFFLEHAVEDKFDIIFLDGLHTFEQTFRDFCNSLAHCHERTIWVIDDTVPRDVYSTLTDHAKAVEARKNAGGRGNAWHGDIFKVVFAIHDFFPSFSFCTLTTNGNPQTLFWKKPQKDFQPKFNNLETISRLNYFDFIENIHVLNLMTEEEGLNLIVNAITM